MQLNQYLVQILGFIHTFLHALQSRAKMKAQMALIFEGSFEIKLKEKGEVLVPIW